MTKTTILLDFGSGASEVVGPMTVYVRPAMSFLSGNKVILPGPGPVILDRAGRATVQLDAEQVWEFVVSAPSYMTKPSYRFVPTATVPIQYAELVEVAAPPKTVDGVPYWASEVLDARVKSQAAVEAAETAAAAAEQARADAQALVNSIEANGAFQVWQAQGNTGTEADFLASLEGRSAFDIWREQPGNETKTEADFLASLKGPKGDPGTGGSGGGVVPFYPVPAATWPVVSAPTRTITVSTRAALDAAMADAAWQDGDKIVLQPGNYGQQLTVTKTPTSGGTQASPPKGVWLYSAGGAIFDRGDVTQGYAASLTKANYLRIEGITFRNGLKGVMAYDSHYLQLKSILVEQTGQEGVHFLNGSTDCSIETSEIRNTGMSAPGYGEGLYVGQSSNNWTGGVPDKTDRISAISNYIHHTTAEPLDFKEGTRNHVILKNRLGGESLSGENGANSFGDFKCSDSLIQENTTENPAPIVANVFTTLMLIGDSGAGNVFRKNVLISGGATDAVSGAPVGINIVESSRFGAAPLNMVYDDNIATNVSKLTNVPVMPTAPGSVAVADITDITAAFIETFLKATSLSGARQAIGAAPNGFLTGPTSGRPTNAVLRSVYEDTTINRPIYLAVKGDGTGAGDVWKDFMGNIADVSYNASTVSGTTDASYAAMTPEKQTSTFWATEGGN